MIIPALSPTMWKAAGAVALVAAVVAGGAYYRSHVWQLGYDKAVADRAASDLKAIGKRTKDNAELAVKQDAINTKIEKVKNEELAPVRERIVTRRVYVGTGICGPAAPAQAEDATSSDGGDSPGRLVSQEAAERIRELELEVEAHLATGRACQQFGKENGFYP